MQYKYLDALQLQKMLLAGSQNLEANKDNVDALNVFPVPDGDTGTNMNLTLVAAVREVEKLAKPELKSLAQAVANGALMGARGNSGVILSQLFRGFSQVLEASNDVDAKVLAKAAQNAVDVAYKAVIKPVEGTILTVAKAAAKGAKEAATGGADCFNTLNSALRHAQAALEKTPQMLPALAKAGVVDAGGKGLCLIIEGAISGLVEESLNPTELAGETMLTVPKQFVEPVLTANQAMALEYPYCTEFIIKGIGLSQELIRRALEDHGDSLLVVGNDDVTKIHIHTNNPGKVLDYAIGLGSLHDIKIDNMEEQHQERILGGDGVPLSTEELKPQKNTGILAVSVGQGLVDILKSLGCDVVVSGGQTMNPSTEDLIAGIREVNAQQVYVLPNNKNIILAAEQAKEVLDDIEVIVIPSRSFPQGMAALLAFDPEGTPEENSAKMTAALNSVKSGELTYAVRDSQFDGLEIREGQVLGILEGKITNTGDSISVVGENLVKEMLQGDGELLSLFYGSEVSLEEAEALSQKLSQSYPELEIEIHFGGQPLYYYIIALE